METKFDYTISIKDIDLEPIQIIEDSGSLIKLLSELCWDIN